MRPVAFSVRASAQEGGFVMAFAQTAPRWGASPWFMLSARSRVQIPEDGESYPAIPGPKKLREKYGKPKMRKGLPVCAGCTKWIDGTVYWLSHSGRSPYTNEMRTVRQAYCARCAGKLVLQNPKLKFECEVRK